MSFSIRIIVLFHVLVNHVIFKAKHVTFGGKLRVRGPIKLWVGKGAVLTIGERFTLISGLMVNPLGRNLKSSIRIDKNAKVIIGDNVGMSCVSIWAKNEILIGNNVKVGADVLIFDSDMHALDFNLRRSPNTDSLNALSKKIRIGDDVFIGARSIICKGVELGDRCIIGTGSVVTQNIPADEIWGGNPARFIKKIHN